MRTTACLSIALTAALLGGCSLTLPVRGTVQGTGETFTGTATGYTNGSGTMALTSTSGTTCKGSFVYVTQRSGQGTMECADGRTGPFDFVSAGQNGTGKGALDGKPFTFTFGGT